MKDELILIEADMMYANVVNWQLQPIILVRRFPIQLQVTPHLVGDLRELGIPVEERVVEDSHYGVVYIATIKDRTQLAVWLGSHCHSFKMIEVDPSFQGVVDWFPEP